MKIVPAYLAISVQVSDSEEEKVEEEAVDMNQMSFRQRNYSVKLDVKTGNRDSIIDKYQQSLKDENLESA